MINILLVDDHPSVVEGTKILLEKEQDMKVSIETSANDALHTLTLCKFDVMLFDLYMPEMNGIELTKKVLEIDPDAIILIYSGFDISAQFNLLVETGITGFISKTSKQEQLITAVRCALRKEAVIPVSLLKYLRRIGTSVSSEDMKSHKIAINSKEALILQYLADGKSNREISQSLHVSQRSLEYGLTELFQKLGVRSRVEAVIKAKDLGLLFEEKILNE